MVYTIPGAPSVHRPNDFTDSHSSNDLAAELKKVCLRKVVVARALAIRATYLVIQSLYYRAHGRNSQKSIEKTIFIKHTHTHTHIKQQVNCWQQQQQKSKKDRDERECC